MDDSLPALLPAAGLLIGVAFGAVTERSGFCTMGAVSDWAGLGDTTRLKAWALAAAIAILGTQILAAAGWVDPARSIHGGARLVWLGHLLGGALFGVGMTLAGGCASRSLARLGAGNLKSLVVVLVLGIVAMATMRGVLAPLRAMLGAATSLPLPAAQTLPDLSGAGASAAGRLALALACALPLAAWALADRNLRDRASLRGGALMIGGLVVAGWAATGILCADAFDPVPPASLTFVGPTGESIVYLMFATGSSFTFAIATCLGVVVGAALSARMRGSFRWESFATRQDLVRHVAGAAAMGCGAVLAGGCTIGQGVTAASAMALGAPLTVAGILAGGALTTGFLAEGSWRAAWTGLLRPRRD
jgi:uncharacterized membrane protein YedE/YeeE